ncbi:MAG: hypothetical protein QNJ17_04655 [Desulfocapsaceae bacterium]|nr:hypothetical protein [Desulfocapsaceae bacterium]
MKQPFVLIALLTILSSCASGKHQAPPALTSSQARQDNAVCGSIFPQDKWQFVHSLEFTRIDGIGTTVIGITNLDENALHTALLTIEGFTLFEADFYNDERFEVHRAVPPFDNPNFAKGMMRDIRTIFRPPQGMLILGVTNAPDTVCRYTDDNGRITDVLPGSNDYQDDCWQIRRYSAEQDIDLSVIGKSCLDIMSAIIPEHLELHSYGVAGYTLKMKLLSADRL